jgi:hypothetical protein
MDKDLSSPLVTKLAQCVWWLRIHSFHGFAKRKIRKLREDHWIEKWVIFFTLVSFIAFLLAPTMGFFGCLTLLLGIYRLYEIALNVLHATIFYGVIDRKPIAGYRRIIILFFVNLMEIVLWFAYFYRRIPSQFSQPDASFSISTLSYSFSTATGVGSSLIQPTDDISAVVSLIESGLGLFMIVAVISKFISGLATDLDKNSA